MAISMLKIRRPLGRLIFNMGIAIPGETVFLIETAPRSYHHITVLFYHCYEYSSYVMHENDDDDDRDDDDDDNHHRRCRRHRYTPSSSLVI